MGTESTVTRDVFDERIYGTRLNHFVREFFLNSAYFPLANIFLEMLNRPGTYATLPDPYVLLLAALVQARFISYRTYTGRHLPLLGNLIGPLIYTIFELFFGSGDFAEGPNHVAYWCFAFAIGASQQMRLYLPVNIGSVLMLFETTLRTSILLVMYIIIEDMQGQYQGLVHFMGDPSHAFIAVVVPFSGLMLGIAHVDAERTGDVLRSIAAQMKQYAQWILGKELLEQSAVSPDSLSRVRQQRTLLVIEIRGFNPWSVKQEPSRIIEAVNAYYEAAEPTWQRFNALRVKFDADQIVVAFGDATTAVAAALEMHEYVGEALGRYGLSAGIAVHTGPVVEGLLGSTDFKNYDLLGETLNVARGLCDNAGMGEVLLSSETVQDLEHPLPLSHPMSISMKENAMHVTAYAVAGINSEA